MERQSKQWREVIREKTSCAVVGRRAFPRDALIPLPIEVFGRPDHHGQDEKPLIRLADSLVDRLAEREITPVMPPKANRKTKRDCDFALYRERNLTERFCNKIKHFRAIASRYDKLATNFSRRSSTGLGYHPPQLRTGSSEATWTLPACSQWGVWQWHWLQD
jgi:hypothetical protein